LGRVTSSCASLSEWGQWATGTKWAPPGDRRESLPVSWTAGPGFFLGISLDLTQHERHRSLLGRKPGSFSEWELEAGPGGPAKSEIELSGTSTWLRLQRAGFGSALTYSSLGAESPGLSKVARPMNNPRRRAIG